MNNIIDFSSKITLEAESGEAYVFTNKDLPKYLLKAIDTFCNAVETRLDIGVDYSDLIRAGGNHEKT
jgi:hypothetical protein